MGKGVNVPSINERFMGMPAEGYLTPEDQAFLDRMLGRSAEFIDSGTQQQQGSARARLAQRRVGGAAAEQVVGDIGASGALARARAAGSVADVGRSIFEGNKNWARGNIRTAWAAELGAHSRYDARRAAQAAAWGNAVSGLAGLAGQSIMGGAGVPQTGIASPPGIGSYDIPDAVSASPPVR